MLQLSNNNVSSRRFNQCNQTTSDKSTCRILIDDSPNPKSFNKEIALSSLNEVFSILNEIPFRSKTYILLKYTSSHQAPEIILKKYKILSVDYCLAL